MQDSVDGENISMGENTEEICVLDVIDDAGWCHVVVKGKRSVMQLDPGALKNCGFSLPAKKTLPNKSEGVLEWGTSDTRMLLDLYTDYLKDVGPMKKFKNKKGMWAAISTAILNNLHLLRTPAQCETRYKTVLKRKAVAAAKNHHSGDSPEPVQYEAEIDKIKSLDDSVQPEVLWGVGRSKSKLKPTENTENAGEPPEKKGKVVPLSVVLYTIHKEKERNKDKRHKEKLDLLRELLGKPE